jgi:tRNA(Arg) A34 adenosine deaminase TadA
MSSSSDRKPVNRRAVLSALAVSSVLAAGKSASAQPGPGVQPARADGEGFMAVAADMLDEAVKAGDQPFGAVVVKNGKIVGWGPSRVVSNTDPTAHAEMVALRDAATRLGTRDLSGCTMYSTSHPCPMCEAGAYWAGIDRFVHGSARRDGGAPRLRRC